MTFEWTQDYAVGVTQFDDQHKELFRLINKLEATLGSGRDSLKEVLDGLIAYAAMHFKTEEDLMTKTVSIFQFCCEIIIGDFF